MFYSRNYFLSDVRVHEKVVVRGLGVLNEPNDYVPPLSQYLIWIDFAYAAL